MSVFETAIGWLAPPLCIACGQEGHTLCLACATSEIVPFGQHCWHCNASSPLARTCHKCRLNSPRHVWITTVYDNLSGQLIKIYKFAHQRAAADSLSKLMVETLLDFIDERRLKELDYLIVPIPTATSRVRLRSFDHSELLARKIARRLGMRLSICIGRLGQTRQVGTRRAVRLANSEGKYYLKQAVKGRNIILIDDVVTTGATIRAVTKELRRAGARRVDALIFAKKL